MKIRNKKDFWGGVMFAVLGFLFAIIAYGVKLGDTVLIPGYSMGVPARMGPAFFPYWLGVILFLLGVAVAVMGMTPKAAVESFPKFHFKPNFWVLGAIVLFGLIAGVILIVVASRGSEDFRLKRSILLGVGLSVFCALVFVAGLKLPIPLCPDLEMLQSAKMCQG